MKEETGVATVSSPEVGDNVQMPLGASPPTGKSYRKRNERDAKKIMRLKEWLQNV